MESSMIVKLINNATLLMSLFIIYEISYSIPMKFKKQIPYFKGLIIGMIGIGIMMVPFKLQNGIVFDLRSVLICTTAFSFGVIPTVISSALLILFRIFIGGTGTQMGIAVIFFSALMGLVFRSLIQNKKMKYHWFNIYLFGITVHLVMLFCTVFLPKTETLNVFKSILIPILLLYPICTVVLCLLLDNQNKRNNSALKIAEAEERYRSLFDSNHAVMLLIDPENGKILDANNAASWFYGWSKEKLITMNISQINILDHVELFDKMNDSVQENTSHFLFQHRIASGKVIDVEVYSGPIIVNGKKIIYSIVHNISERIAAENALKESEQRFRLLVENAPDAIFIHTEGKFTYVNSFSVKLFGASSWEDLIGMDILERFHPDYHEVIKERIETVNDQNGQVAILEEIIIRFDGKYRYVEVIAVPIRYKNKMSGLVYARDITERKNLEMKKAEIEVQLRQQQKLEAIGTLAGGVAHEINNPINGIMNYAQLILDELRKDTVEATYATEIIHETERISYIVKNLLQFSRQEKQSHSYASIYDIINQTISLINTVIKRDQIELRLLLDESLPDIKCRSQQIQQVLMNLLTNAKDALNEKYPQYSEDKIISIYCILFVSEGRRWVKLTVEDHGNGIPKEMHEKIFEPFFSTKPKEKGTGLGLAISFGIVKDHHGTITIDTKEGAYTKFIVELPVDNGWNLSE